MSKPVKIISLVWYKVLPANFGGQKGIANFNEALGKLFPLVCLCSKNNKPGGAKNYQVFNYLPNSKSQIFNPVVWWDVLRFVRKEKATHIIIEHPYHLVTGWLLKTFLHCTVITHSHNIEYLRLKQAGKWYWPLAKIFERLVYHLSAIVSFKTKQDQAQAIKQMGLKADNTMMIPYGTEKKPLENQLKERAIIREAHNLPADQKILLFNGTLDYAPNANAVTDLVNLLLPILPKNYTIIITGRNEFAAFQYLNNLRSQNFIMVGFTENVDAYFLAADVYVNAVNEGGGVQTKNIEALSFDLNVVCWHHMLNGIDDAVTGDKIHSAKPNDWKDFLARVLVATIINNPTPESFFEYYSFNNHVQFLKEWIIKTSN